MSSRVQLWQYYNFPWLSSWSSQRLNFRILTCFIMRQLPCSNLENRSECGFTMTETITCLMVGITLFSIAAAAGSIMRSPSNQTRCLNNLRTLTVAWSVYADENQGRLAGVAGGLSSRPDWAGGRSWLNLDGQEASNIDPEVHLSQSPLLPYLTSHLDQASAYQIFRCPADPSVSRSAEFNHRRLTPRVRSYSMNNWMGGLRWIMPSWITFSAKSEFTALPPSKAMVFTGERADSINDSVLYIDMTGYEDSTTLSHQSRIIDYPAFYHGGGASISFADGHVINKKWRDPRTVPAFSLNRELTLNVLSPNNPDVLWLQDHATRLR